MATLKPPPSMKRNEVWSEVHEIFTPRKRELPSEWAERERFLNPDTTPRPGRWRNDYLPWIRPMLDAWVEEPWRLGWVCMKYAQAGVSEIAITLMGFLYAFFAGPTLFVCSRKDQARKFGLERVGFMIEHSPTLRKIFRRGKAHNETLFYKEAQGGPLMLAGSSSPNEYISNPARFGFVDELDDVGEIRGHGDAWHVMEKRTGEYRTRQRIGLFGWAHPRRPGTGIAKLFEEDSDRREWTIDCAHCGRPLVLSWDDVRWTDRADPATYTYHCPHDGCGEEITDAQRWAATWKGRFVSPLPPKEARRRRFIGFHFTKLCHPRVTLYELAQTFAACSTEAQLQAFYNKDLGLPYIPASTVLTEEMVRRRQRQEQAGRTCPRDTLFVTAGVDVQKPKDNPTLYYAIVAWTRRSTAVLIEYGRVQGWTLLDMVLRECHVRRPGEGGAWDELRIAACMIDHGYETQQVYDFCRQEHGGVPCVPYKHTPAVKAHEPTRRKETRDPLRPELGAMVRIETHRTYWMDRALGRFALAQEDLDVGGIVLPAQVDAEFVNHILANVRFDGVDEHGHPVGSYVKEESRRDDWLQCLVGCEIAAVAKGLDKLHQAIPAKPATAQREVTEGFVEPATRTRQREEHTPRERGLYRGNRSRGHRRLW